MSLTLSSPSFSDGGIIAKNLTCLGADVSPEFSWSEPPAEAKTLALLVDDLDAPIGKQNHWTLWNLPAIAHSLPEGVTKEALHAEGAEQGRNDFHKTNGYQGPCPPSGNPHRYYFRLYALDARLDLKSGADEKELEAAMKGHILARGELMGRYGW